MSSKKDDKNILTKKILIYVVVTIVFVNMKNPIHFAHNFKIDVPSIFSIGFRIADQLGFCCTINKSRKDK